MRLVPFLFLFLCGHANAQWERTDTWMLGAALGVTALDWNQTRKITRKTQYFAGYFSDNGAPPQPFYLDSTTPYYEQNPILGHDPSIAEINRLFIASMAGTAALAYVLPRRYRRWFLGGVIVFESALVINNHRIGLRISY